MDKTYTVDIGGERSHWAKNLEIFNTCDHKFINILLIYKNWLPIIGVDYFLKVRTPHNGQ